LAQDEARREEHARLVVERAGDPQFVQRRIAHDGSVSLHWDSDTPAGHQLHAALQGQLDAFRQKFGREPGAKDPIFFDPDADTPVPMSQDRVASLLDEMVEAAERAGVDPTLMKASRDVGYIVTTENQHLFSAAELQAWQDAVERYQAEDDDDLDDGQLDDLLDLLADELEAAVEHTLVERSTEPARALAERIMDTDLAMADDLDEEGDSEGAPGTPIAFAILAGWLSAARDDHADAQIADRVLAWVHSSLGPECARLATPAAGILGAAANGDLTVQQLADELQEDFLPALVWLTAGVVAEYGGGDVAWLRRHEDEDDDLLED
jgi:hypothetical protein